tara:strand:- start:211 stop:345 length:135 start_codon:yes stop_codon:yes gene_type:complete
MEQTPSSKKPEEYFEILEEQREFPYKAVLEIILVYYSIDYWQLW